MDIPALSMAVSQNQLMTNISIAVLGKSLDRIQQSGDQFTKMLEQSVSPNLGQSIDVTV